MSILLFILFAVCQALMVEIRSHWDRVFAHWFPKGTWTNPAISWQNKYKLKPVWLFSTALVWVTDLWHFLQFISLNSIFLLVLLYENETLKVWQYAVELLVLNICWGTVFEGVMIVFSWISEKYKKKI